MSVHAWFRFLLLSASLIRFNTQTANKQHTHISQRCEIFLAFDQGRVDGCWLRKETTTAYFSIHCLSLSFLSLVYSFLLLFTKISFVSKSQLSTPFPLIESYGHGGARATSCKGVAKKWLPFLWPDYRVPSSSTDSESPHQLCANGRFNEKRLTQ